MSNLKEKTLGLVGFLLALSLSTFSAQAQEDAVEDAEVQVQEADDDDDAEEVVVTGSRLRKTSFTSIAPLQVISMETSREVGLIDPAEILQESTAAGGQQIDLTFAGFVLDNGPGASTVSLRGLGAGRTLVMINGRRVAPAGVEGAPSSPDLNLLPAALVERYEILLDGASSVYGSDAIAGVTNVILRKDFDGFEFDINTEIPAQSGNETTTFSAAWGKNYDRGFFGLGAEYETREPLTTGDRTWTGGCDEHVEVDQAGRVRNTGLSDQFFGSQRTSPCKRGGLGQRMFLDDQNIFGSIYYTGAESNTGIPGFSDSSLLGFPIDSDGDGVTDISFTDYSISGTFLDAHIYPEFEKVSVMSYGEYTLEGNMNLTPFFEANYNKREVFSDNGVAQLFPDVPAGNPYSPCNPAGVDGIDCESIVQTGPLADTWNSAEFRDFFANRNFATCDRFGFTLAQCSPELFGYGFSYGSVAIVPIIGVDGDRTQTNSDVSQIRFVGGVRGDLPQIPLGGNNDWNFEISTVYSKADGNSSREGVRGDKLDYSLNTSRIENGSVVCGDATTDSEFGSVCVPVNIFAPSLYSSIRGDFATQAERDYLFDSRDFNTEYIQWSASSYISGSVFELPGGTAAAGIGLEYRHDELTSNPDDVAKDGLLFGFFSDAGAIGEKETKEAYGEISLPLLANQPFAKKVDLDLASRWTNDEFYGSAGTYSAKLGWSPSDNLLLRATYGTSYRAPNLRENFLLGQTGFNTVFDPCATPTDALLDLNGVTVYDATQDDRDPLILANCAREGLDPTNLDLGTGFASVEVSRGGDLNLLEETSDSVSYGFSYEQPFFDAFDMTLGMTYYKIEIENTIIEPSSQFIVNDCYTTAGPRSIFCSRIQRDGDLFLDFVDGAFLNRDSEIAEGLDLNVGYDMPLTIFDRAYDLSADLRMNRTISRSTKFLDDEGVADEDEFAGEFGFPAWKGSLDLRMSYNKYRLAWNMNYIGPVEQDTEFRDDFDDIFGNSDTCLGPTQGDLLCRDVGYAPSHVTHAMSLTYRGDRWVLGAGVRNLFDKEPPRVDGSEVTAINNVPIGYGYDINGRSYFIRVGAQF